LPTYVQQQPATPESGLDDLELPSPTDEDPLTLDFGNLTDSGIHAAGSLPQNVSTAPHTGCRTSSLQLLRSASYAHSPLQADAFPRLGDHSPLFGQPQNLSWIKSCRSSMNSIASVREGPAGGLSDESWNSSWPAQVSANKSDLSWRTVAPPRKFTCMCMLAVLQRAARAANRCHNLSDTSIIRT